MRLLLLLCGLMIAIAPAFAQSGNHYAYLVVSQDQTRAAIQFVDADDFTNPQPLTEIPIKQGYTTPSFALLNPQGEWVALFYPLVSAGFELQLGLFNLHSHELRLPPIRITTWSTSIVRIEEHIQWSPDGRFIASDRAMQPEHTSDVFIYDLEQDTLLNITNDPDWQYRIVWSSDSTRVLTRTHICEPGQGCNAFLDVIDVTFEQRQRSPSLTGVLDHGFGNGCEHVWSPDGKYVGFVISPCEEVGTAEFAREVFIWNIEDNSFMQVTNYTVPYHLQNRCCASAEYQLAWFEAQTLLIGAFILLPPPALYENTQTSFYRLNTEQVTPFSALAADGWAVNPVFNQVAARMRVARPGTSDQFAGDYHNRSGFVQVFAVSQDEDGAAHTDVIGGAPGSGCDLAWSPDGTLLAYTVRRNNLCLESVERLMIYNPAQAVWREIHWQGGGLVPVGWLVS
jgi:WD40 repeat protein